MPLSVRSVGVKFQINSIHFPEDIPLIQTRTLVSCLLLLAGWAECKGEVLASVSCLFESLSGCFYMMAFFQPWNIKAGTPQHPCTLGPSISHTHTLIDQTSKAPSRANRPQFFTTKVIISRMSFNFLSTVIF